MNKIKDILLKNNFPYKLLNKILNNNPTSIKVKENQNHKFAKIPYVKGLSERLAGVVSDDEVKITFKNENTINKYFSKLKDKTPNELQSGVVYKIPCSDCQGLYVGQTGRYLKTRISEHERSVKPTNYAASGKTALAEHSFNQQHQFDFNSTQIIGRESNYKKRILLEMVNIKKYKESINKKQDTDDLSASYYNLINLLPKR